MYSWVPQEVRVSICNHLRYSGGADGGRWSPSELQNTGTTALHLKRNIKESLIRYVCWWQVHLPEAAGGPCINKSLPPCASQLPGRTGQNKHYAEQEETRRRAQGRLTPQPCSGDWSELVEFGYYKMVSNLQDFTAVWGYGSISL